MVYLQITMKVPAAHRKEAASVYRRFRTQFLNEVPGAKSKEMLVRDDDVQVLHGFETTAQANAYLKSTLFVADVVDALKPLLEALPDIRVYQAA